MLAQGQAAVDLSHRGVVRVDRPGPALVAALAHHPAPHRPAPHAGPAGAGAQPARAHRARPAPGRRRADRLDHRGARARRPRWSAFLDKMRFMLRVEVADVTADWAAVSAAGGRGVAGQGARLAPPEPDLGRRHRDTAGRRHRSSGGPAARCWCRARRLADALAAGWPGRGRRGAADRRRRPRHGFETDHRTIPHELGCSPAVHLNKGCYRGQETVARVHNLGRPPRRLVFLHLDGSGPHLPVSGTPVTPGGRAVGHAHLDRVTTSRRPGRPGAGQAQHPGGRTAWTAGVSASQTSSSLPDPRGPARRPSGSGTAALS